MTTLALLGASGRTGQSVLHLALKRGITVRTLARRAPNPTWPGAQVTVGDVTDVDAVAAALAKTDAVVMAVGPRPPSTDVFCAAATRATLEAMTRCGVERLVCVTGAMIGDYPNLDLGMRLIRRSFARSRPEVARDRAEQERLLMESGVAWTIVKPARLTDGPGTGRMRVGEELRVGLFDAVSREDLALVLLDACTDERTVGRRLFVA